MGGKTHSGITQMGYAKCHRVRAQTRAKPTLYERATRWH